MRPFAVSIAGLVLLGSAAAGDGARKVTFNRDIAPIVFHSCAPCHRPGEGGPFPLLSYRDVASHARQIVTVTASRFMPPWLPDKGDYPFEDEARLTGDQISLFARWVKDGELEGAAKDLPALPHFVEGWQLGEPDMILKAAKPFLLPASGSDTYWNFVLSVPVERTRWVKAIEIRPGNKKVVHHANILLDRLGTAREMETAPGAGFGGMEIRVESEVFDPDSHLLFWKPGTRIEPEPDGLAFRVDKGTDLLLNAHLQPSGKPELIQPKVGLYFTDKPADKKPMLLEIEHDSALDIPAGVKNFVVTDHFTLPLDVDVMAVYPHAHYLGKDILAAARFPDGTKKTLIHIPRWDVNWQAVYTYARPVTLPRGTVITMRYTYDNSEDNIANPNHPPQRVVGGNRATDEMAHLWLQVLPHGAPDSNLDPRMILQEALSRHEVEKDAANFEAQYNLAAIYSLRGDVKEALPHYEAAARIRPKDPVVNNALGSALLANGEVGPAIERLKEALAARPGYFDAHYNLGIAYSSEDDPAEAAREFGEAVRLKPDDANAHANHGATLAQLGRFEEAKRELETALKIQPRHELAKENLAQVNESLAREKK
jgi:Tfp pilus assembly protein PilF